MKFVSFKLTSARGSRSSAQPAVLARFIFVSVFCLSPPLLFFIFLRLLLCKKKKKSWLCKSWHLGILASWADWWPEIVRLPLRLH